MSGYRLTTAGEKKNPKVLPEEQVNSQKKVRSEQISVMTTSQFVLYL